MNAAARGTLPASLTLVGAGKMGAAMLDGWLAAGLDPRRTTILDFWPSDAVRALCAARGLALNPSAVAPADILVVAIKPQSFSDAASDLDRMIGPGTLVLSILAGKTIADLKGRLPNARRMVRTMPNLPASIGRGATGAVASPEVTPAQRAAVDTLLAANGLVEWVGSEAEIDAVTALSGSGPAYVFLMVEAMAAAGIAAGLDPAVAERLARATVSGAGALLDASDLPASELRRNVTSPGGHHRGRPRRADARRRAWPPDAGGCRRRQAAGGGVGGVTRHGRIVPLPRTKEPSGVAACLVRPDFGSTACLRPRLPDLHVAQG